MSHEKQAISRRNCREQFYLTKKFVKLNNPNASTQTIAVAPTKSMSPRVKEQAPAKIDLDLVLFSESTR